MLLSIVIVSYNTKSILFACLESIRGLLNFTSHEIIIVDNSSHDGTVELLEKKFSQVKLIKNDRNLGFGVANNEGMYKAKGQFILLLNSDTIVSPVELNKCLDYMQANPCVGLLGCKLLNQDLTFQESCGNFYRMSNAIFGGMDLNKLIYNIPFVRFRFPAYLFPESDCNATKEVDWVSGAFMLLRKEVFIGSKGFDENIFLYGEEMEWCFRIKKLGWRIVYYPEAYIIHIGRVSGKSLSEISRIKKIIAGKNYFFLKHFGFCKALLFRNLLLFSSLFKLPFFLVMYLSAFSKEYSKDRLLFSLGVISWYFSSIYKK